MQTLFRKLFWSLPVLIPLVCLSVIVWKVQADATQARRNQALIAAVKADEPVAAIAALRQGADANCRDIPPDTQTLWQKLRDWFQQIHLDTIDSPTALALAIGRDLDAERPPSPEASFVLIAALHDAGARLAGGDGANQPELLTGETALNQLPNAPTVHSDESLTPDWKSPFLDAIDKHGFSARAYHGLARSRFREGDYAGAVHAFRIAQLWLTQNKEIAAERARAEEAERVRNAIAAQPFGGYELLETQPYLDEPGGSLWAALYGRKGELGNHDIHVALFRQTGADVQRLAFSEMLPDLDHDDEPSNKHDFASVNVYVMPLTRRLPELMIEETTEAVTYEPTQLHVLEWRGSRFRSLLSLHSNWPCWIEDHKQDGRWIIRNDYETGIDLSHSDMPHRCDFYAFNSDRYVFADTDYPGDFKDYIEEAAARLAEHPNDYDLCYNLYYLYRITGKRAQSERCYRDALRLFRELALYAGNDWGIARHAAQYKRMLARAPVYHWPAVLRKGNLCTTE